MLITTRDFLRNRWEFYAPVRRVWAFFMAVQFALVALHGWLFLTGQDLSNLLSAVNALVWMVTTTVFAWLAFERGFNVGHLAAQPVQPTLDYTWPLEPREPEDPYYRKRDDE